MIRVCRLGWAVVLLLAVGARPVPAQSTADAYFHEAAQQYVADDVQAARRTVEQGLKVAPSDPRLLALRKKLRQGSRSNRRPNRDSTSESSKKQTQKDANSSSDETAKGGEPSPEQSGGTQSGDRSASSKRTGPRSSKKRPPARPTGADTMRRGRGGRPVDSLSRTQAERLLRALEGQERRLLRQLPTRSSKRRPVEKDW